jgi:hypothetical protein
MTFFHLKIPMQFSLLFAFFILCFPSAFGQTPKDIGQLFAVDHIVPDLLPSFNPSVLFDVTYNATVIPGQILSQNGKVASMSS